MHREPGGQRLHVKRVKAGDGVNIGQRHRAAFEGRKKVVV
jgi:hypothetical protein